MLTIRPLETTDDLDTLTGLLHCAYARLGAMGLNYTAVNQGRDVTEQRIRGGQCFVAQWSGVLVGTIVVQPTYTANECDYFTRPGVAVVHQFGVEPSLHGKGIGQALLARCESWARERGFRELAMDTAEPAEHLVRLYAGLGYGPVGHVQWSGKVYRSVVLSKRLQEEGAVGQLGSGAAVAPVPASTPVAGVTRLQSGVGDVRSQDPTH